MAGEFRLMCVGDIHLGRRPSRLSDRVDGFGVGIHELTPAAAWQEAVDWALKNDVDAVALAGDVVESLEDRFEAYGHLERGVRRLTAGSIPVVGVAGNHDVFALPRLADRLPDFMLLGRGGKWETIELESASGEKLRILGWSFPEKVVRSNPLEQLPIDIDSSVPTVGLLHCDLDQSGSPYAPVPRRAFETAPGAAWLLGHVHSPSDLGGQRPVGYLGSLVGLDAGEPGLHGPWIARISDDARICLEHIPLAPIRWEAESVAIDQIGDVLSDEVDDELAALLVVGMQAIHRRIEPTIGSTRVVGCRLRLTGRSVCHRKLRQAAENEAVAAQIRTFGDDVVYFVEKIIDEAAPALDLPQLAEARDLPGLLARRILSLQQGGAEADQLVAQARRTVDAANQFAAIEDDESSASDKRTRMFLLRAGVQALEDLLDQQGDVEGGYA